ncbi:hypothetical protein E2C01_013404 [Portunus trituberculatus]|uniref:Uncharacterized protein n=1 Tax=Portunus trituberculatus TaxID=210409 RepID=A0A5B7DGJ8_PORTR|nr:hypothetical protein [Portunus trituberculatus]
MHCRISTSDGLKGTPSGDIFRSFLGAAVFSGANCGSCRTDCPKQRGNRKEGDPTLCRISYFRAKVPASQLKRKCPLLTTAVQLEL